jgi:hypothetical protein
MEHKRITSSGYGLLRTCAVMVLLATMAAPATATLIKSYDFNGDYSDSLGNGLDLIAGGGALGGGRYDFGANQGLKLENALSNTSDYAIEIKFQMLTFSPFWKKLLDYQDLTTDTGLYIANDRMSFYDSVGDGVTPMPILTDVVARITRNGATNEVQGFLENILQWTFDDAANIAVSGVNILNFFEDDFITGKEEFLVGSTDWIRIYDTSSVPEPSTLALLALGLAGVGFRRRQKQIRFKFTIFGRVATNRAFVFPILRANV